MLPAYIAILITTGNFILFFVPVLVIVFGRPKACRLFKCCKNFITFGSQHKRHLFGNFFLFIVCVKNDATVFLLSVVQGIMSLVEMTAKAGEIGLSYIEKKLNGFDMAAFLGIYLFL